MSAYWYIVVFFLPGVDLGGYTSGASFRRGDVHGIVDDDGLVGFVKLVRNVFGYANLRAIGAGHQDVQKAAAFARQFAKGVEGGLQVALLHVYLDGEVDGGRGGIELAPSEIVAPCLIGDEGLNALDVLQAADVDYLEPVGLDDGGGIGFNSDRGVLYRWHGNVYFLVGHQEVVGRIDDGARSLVLASTGEA